MALTTETLSARHIQDVDAVEVAYVLDDLERLCSAEFAGRRVGSTGHDLARDWLATRLVTLGFEVATRGGMADVAVLEVTGEPTLVLGGRRLRYRRDFAEHPRSASLEDELTAPVVSADETTAGSWVALEEAPRGTDLDTLVSDLRAGAAIGVLTPQARSPDGYLMKRIAGDSMVLPCLAVEPGLLHAGLGGDATARLPLRRTRPELVNVVGYLPAPGGRAPLLIGAHYDGLGDDTGGERLPGASDNAAGVAVVLEVARLLTEAALTRPLYVLAFDGEEINAQGSALLAREFADSPLVVNLDGAARLNETVAVEPSPNSEEILTALDAAARAYQIPLSVAPVASDNRRFAAAGHPAVGIGLGLAAMHSPADTPELVDPEALLVATQLLLATALHLSAR